MDITKEKLKEIGFKTYYRDTVWRILIGKNILDKNMYLTLVYFESDYTESSYTWYINSFEQFTGLTSMKRLKSILIAVGYKEKRNQNKKIISDVRRLKIQPRRATKIMKFLFEK